MGAVPWIPQTVWEPQDDEAEAAALGTLGMCESLVLPLSIVPGVGSYVGLAAEWACLVPAAFATQNVALHHGDHAPYLWQIFIPLVAQKTFDTVIAIPFPIFVFAGGLAGVGLGAASFWQHAPVGLTVGLAVAPPALIFLGYKFVQEHGGELVFSGLYGVFDNALEGEEHAEAARTAWLGPRVTGIPGALAIVSTAAGAEAPFSLPVGAVSTSVPGTL